MTESPFTIIYITSRGHSGSTLLDLLLSSHSKVASVGEAKVLSAHSRALRVNQGEEEDHLSRPCTCDATPILACPFWKEVNEKLQDKLGVSLCEVDLAAEDDDAFKANNQAFFTVAAEISGCRYIVDLSKDISRLERLLDAGFDLRPIYLVRSPQGVAHSSYRRSGEWMKTTARYTMASLATDRILRHRDYHFVTYETMTSQPENVLREAMQWLGLDFEPGQLDWAEQTHHHIAGNRMRFSKTSEIKCDDSWVEELPALQKMAVRLIAMPATWVHRSR